jgi:hypothetical protein
MTPLFGRAATGAGVLAAAAGIVYTVTFALVVQKGYHWAMWASSATLLVGGVAVLVVFVGAHRQFSGGEPDVALAALVVGLAGALGSVLHAMYDIGGLAKPYHGTVPDVPFPADPRGLATFAFTGVALGLFGWLGWRAGVLAKTVMGLALATAACLLIVFLGRLIILNPKSAAVKPFAVLGGIVLAPATYLAFARSFRTAG